MLPADFMSRANQFIAKRREGDIGTALPAEHAFLTLDEVIAIRLYTGPAYQPINGFLRAIANLDGTFREAMAAEAGLTFCATVSHICGAIRKLAAIATASEAQCPLYRGVRGKLPPKVWLPDDAGLVCVTDTAFMSTSLVKSTPIAYMDAQEENVLWEIHAAEQDDIGYHRGADVAILSQFSAEREVTCG